MIYTTARSCTVSVLLQSRVQRRDRVVKIVDWWGENHWLFIRPWTLPPITNPIRAAAIFSCSTLSKLVGDKSGRSLHRNAFSNDGKSTVLDTWSPCSHHCSPSNQHFRGASHATKQGAKFEDGEKARKVHRRDSADPLSRKCYNGADLAKFTYRLPVSGRRAVHWYECQQGNLVFNLRQCMHVASWYALPYQPTSCSERKSLVILGTANGKDFAGTTTPLFQSSGFYRNNDRRVEQHEKTHET